MVTGGGASAAEATAKASAPVPAAAAAPAAAGGGASFSGEMCCICLEQYHATASPPLRLRPCNHHVCQPCFDLLRRTHLSRRTAVMCPACRAAVLATEVDLSLLGGVGDGGGGGGGAGAVPTSSAGNTLVRRPHEFIHDRSEIAFYGIDNSGSMGHRDGKTMLAHVPMRPDSDFLEVASADCRVRWNQPRWSELVEAVRLVALYNLKRGIKAVYMILNPATRGTWRDNVDVVVVDPAQARAALAQVGALFNAIANPSGERVGGSTPLDRLTDEFRRRLVAMHGADAAAANELVSYTLFTDGVPDSKQRFETSLRYLAQECQLGSITVNLTTDDDGVLDYFNSLDTSLGARTNALEGTRFDVIDDLAAEAREVARVGNRFLNYCLPVHVCRMAGCNNPVADELDERVLPPHYVAKLCREAVGGLPRDSPHFSEGDGAAFVAAVRAKMEDGLPTFWDPRAQRRRPLLDTNTVAWYLRPRRGCVAQCLPAGTTSEQARRYIMFAAALVLVLAALLMASKGSSSGYVPQRASGYHGR